VVGAAIRIIHVIQEMRTGGAERIVVTLVREAAEAGHSVAVAAAPGELDPELVTSAARYPLPVLQRRPNRVPAAAWQLRAAFADHRPDVIHVHNPAMAVLTALAGRRRAASLVSVHGVPEDDWRASARLLRLSRIPVVACGPGIAAGLAEACCRPAVTIANGVGPPPPPVGRGELLEMLELPADAQVVLVVGRLVDQKNQQLALRAVAQLPDRVHLVLVGEGADRPALEQLGTALGLAGRVVFAGRRPGRPLMSAADVICLPSRWEGMPLVAMEAMTSGRPVVVTDVRGSRELVDDGRTGLVVPGDDAPALASGIARVLQDPALGARLAAAAVRESAAWSDQAMAQAYLDLYRKLAS
jgi:glycosyltransferase involved in cell wall biosynthesis